MNDLNLFSFPVIAGDQKTEIMSVFESTQVPFMICRVFTVLADIDGKRGEHAHKECNQLLTCVSGAIKL